MNTQRITHKFIYRYSTLNITSFFTYAISVTVSVACILFFMSCNSNVLGQNIKFTDITSKAGLVYEHGYKTVLFDLPITSEEKVIAGGVACGDYDGDGWEDLYVVRGDIGPNLLFRNAQDGTFEEVGFKAGIALTDTFGSGPTFVDIDGDGLLDLFVGGIRKFPRLFLFENSAKETSRKTTFQNHLSFKNDTLHNLSFFGTDKLLPKIFINRGDGTFQDVTLSSGLGSEKNTFFDALAGVRSKSSTFSAAFGDYDLDGDLDMFLAHWTTFESDFYLWKNNGEGKFSDVSKESNLSGFLRSSSSFTPNFADINSDGWPDILIAGDFGTSRVFLNNGDGTFSNITSDVISDENGMGASVADYDNDGDLDWFVTSISDPNGVAEGNWGVSGNRLYRNKGDGTFEDATDVAGVREGFWGWGSCFADFNNDGHLDIFHVNGFTGPSPQMKEMTSEFIKDLSRLFISNGDGTFTEKSEEFGLIDDGQGRGVVCFDYDNDGDIDIFIANNGQSPKLFRNDGGNNLNFLKVKLIGNKLNTQAIGASIFITVAGSKQMRHLQAGSNYASQNPVVAHFGLSNADKVDNLLITWPDRKTTSINDVPVNQLITIKHPDL